jgi:hypothetical protein
VPKRAPGGEPSLLQQEVAEMHQALSTSKSERDALACEVSALQIELEATRELLI